MRLPTRLCRWFARACMYIWMKQPEPAGSRPESYGGSTMRTYLQVPYREKDQAKALGAWWDPDRRSWYVPEGREVAPFARWLPTPEPDQDESDEDVGLYDEWQAGPLLVEFAQRLRRRPYVLLLQQACWRCRNEGYAVEVRLDCDEAEFDALGGDPGPLGMGPCNGEMAFELGGGEVATVPGLDNALRLYEQRTPSMRGRIASFKRRYSHTVGDAYMSQGCPSCDALWGDFPLSELQIHHIHEIAAGQFDGVQLVRAFSFEP